MNASAGPAQDTDDRANILYWGSDKSVNQIADDLDLSKGALYGMIRPLPAACACPLCAAEVVHSNRTARERGRVDCPACGWDGSEDDTLPHEPSLSDLPAVAPEPPLTQRLDFDGRTRTIAGGALLGAAVGLALVLWARRK